MSLHSLLIKNGSRRDLFLGNNLMSFLADFGFIGDARKLFDEMVDRNVVSWTTVISACTRIGKAEEALGIFRQMLDCGEEVPNGHSLSSVLKACGIVRDLELGRWIHQSFVRLDMEFDVVLMNAALDMYVKCGCLDEARILFDRISSSNATTWNTMIVGYTENGEMDEAEKLFIQMPCPNVISYNTLIAGFAKKGSLKALEYAYKMFLEGIKLDVFTFPCVLKTCGSLKFQSMGNQIHSTVMKSGCESDPLVGSALIDMYSKCGLVGEASKLYEGYGGTGFQLLAISNSMISGFASNDYNIPALSLLCKIHRSGLVLDEFNLSGGLKVCSRLQKLRFGVQVHGVIVVYGYHLDHIVGSNLVDLYLKCGSFNKAMAIFTGLPRKDVITWCVFISGCVQYGLNHSAFHLFKVMIEMDIKPDHFVLSIVLKSCSNLAGSPHSHGKQIHGYTVKKGFEMEPAMTTSLIDMYSKCGEIDNSLTVFRAAYGLLDTPCWTAIIAGCGQNGREKEAIGYFGEMLSSGVEPNEVTFLALLSACRHAGLVEEACSYFCVMKDKYGLMPILEHYCCMVDILGRAGLVKEAWNLISDMPCEPDQTLWNSFLGACGIYDHDGDVISKLVAEHVGSADRSTLLMLSNGYAALGMWNNSLKLRHFIKRLGMKQAGVSWVEIDLS